MTNSCISHCNLCSLKGEDYAYPQIHRGAGKKIMFIGEAPGEEEAKQHLAFVGRSGKLLDRWIAYLGINNYVITNIVRHRPPNNRVPTMDEIEACIPYLFEEVQNEGPYYIIALGKTAARTLGCYAFGETVIGKEFFRELGESNNSFPISVLYHPS